MKRKDVQNINIETQNIEPRFEHELFASGFKPYGKGNNTTINTKSVFSINTLDKSSALGSKNDEEIIYKLAKIICKAYTSSIDANNKRAVIKIELTKSLVDNIALIRSLRILWCKLAIRDTQNKLDDKLDVIVEIKNEKLNYKLIHMISALAASIDNIQFSKEIPEKNIKNIELFFSKEFETRNIIDPFSGSKLLEYKTEKFSVNTWKVFTENSFDFEKILQF